MSVNVNQYRSAIGVFNNRSFITTIWYFHVEETTTVGKFSLPFLAINIMVLSFFLLLHLHSLLSPKIQKKSMQINGITSFSNRVWLLPHLVICSVS